jgi:Flp pilus assembly protein TadB
MCTIPAQGPIFSSGVPEEESNIGAYFADKSKRTHKYRPMNSQRTGLRVASIIFGLFAIGHVLRLINQTPVMVGSYHVPMGVSWVALIIAAVLCIWLWRLSSRSGT